MAHVSYPYYLSTDFETTGFDTPFKLPNGKFVNGADYFDILSGTFRILSKDKLLLGELNFVVVHPDERLNRADDQNRKFHATLHEGATFTHAEMYAYIKSQLPKIKELGRAISMYKGQSYWVFETYKEVEALITEMIEECQLGMDKPKPLYLMGKSVHFDRNYIMAKFPNLTSKLSHRSADVSVMANLARQSSSIDVYADADTTSTHHSRDDCIAAENLHEIQLELFRNLDKLSKHTSLVKINKQLLKLACNPLMRWLINRF